MPAGKTFRKTLFVITCLIISISIVGCKENTSGNEQSAQPENPNQNTPAFALDYDNSDQPQVLKAKLFLRSISIKQYHVGQDQPTLYYAKDISRILLHNNMHPHTEEWFLDQIDIHLKDGSVKSEHSFKVWNVQFDIASGKGAKPVPIEQHFSKKR
ncbi:MAG: hypothetical protein ABFR90_07270 [Planctomycetota bacterium]